MEVVNDSTTMQSRIDAVLAAPIMEWDHSPEIQWQPGDPLWKHPEERADETQDWSSPVLEMPHGWMHSRPSTGSAGNCPRYMFEIVGLDDFFVGYDENDDVVWGAHFGHDDTMDGSMYLVDCDDCLVGLGDDEVNCWVCGKRVLMESKAARRRELIKDSERQAQVYMATLWDEMRLPRHILTTPIRSRPSQLIAGLRPMLSMVDEINSYFEWPPVVEEEFVEYASWDANVTARMFRGLTRVVDEEPAVHPYHGPLDINDPSLYVNNYRINLDEPVPQQGALMYWSSAQRRWAEMRLQEIMTEQEPEVPEVPRLTLRETNPDLYRPWYERYFESENDNVRTSPAERRRGHGRAGAPRHRQG